MKLSDSLVLYNQHLQHLLSKPETLERFKLLSFKNSLGCFCDPESSCHVDIIRYYLKTLKLNVPKRVCVKVKYLRKEGIDNLEEWLNNNENCLCTRRGRVFIGTKPNQKIFQYPESEWCNPYKVINN